MRKTLEIDFEAINNSPIILHISFAGEINNKHYYYDKLYDNSTDLQS